MAKTRRTIPESILNKVLLQSKRRCCICYGEGVEKPLQGDVAHIQVTDDRSETTEDNLVFLCSHHHKKLDQGKLSASDVISARRRLYQSLEASEDSDTEKKLLPWQRYERKVTDILRARMGQQFGDFFELNRDPKLVGRSGLRREVSLDITLKALGFSLLILVEIKFRSRELVVSDVEAIGAMFDDVGAAKGIIVCNGGFSRDAIKRAKSMGVGLMRIEADPEERDTKGSDEIVIVA
jgi:hypothetical protein